MLHLIGLINFIADLGLDNIWLKNELGFLLRMYKTGLSSFRKIEIKQKWNVFVTLYLSNKRVGRKIHPTHQY